MAGEVGFFITYRDVVYQLPVNPEELKIKFEGNNKVQETVGLGEINAIRRRKLAEVSFESFFPSSVDSFPSVNTANKFIVPTEYKSLLDGIMQSADSCLLTITGLETSAINMYVSIESFDCSFKAGAHEDIHYSLTLKEYRQFTFSKLSTIAYLPRNYVSGVSKRTTICVTDIVMLNGTVYKDSKGKKKVKTYKNTKVRVSVIKSKDPCPYYVVSTAGKSLGWVKKSAVKLI